MGRVSDAQPEVSDKCLRGLMALIACARSPKVLGEAIIVVRQVGPTYPTTHAYLSRVVGGGHSRTQVAELRVDTRFLVPLQLLQQSPSDAIEDVMVKQLANLLVKDRSAPSTTSSDPTASTVIEIPPIARANLIWIVGEVRRDLMTDRQALLAGQPRVTANQTVMVLTMVLLPRLLLLLLQFQQMVGAAAPDVLRVLAQRFPEEAPEVSMTPPAPHPLPLVDLGNSPSARALPSSRLPSSRSAAHALDLRPLFVSPCH